MTLFEVGTELENILVQATRVDNLLSLFEEDIEREVESLAEGDCWSRYFKERYSRLRSLMESIQQQHSELLCALQKPIDAVYTIDSKEKANIKQNP